MADSRHVLTPDLLMHRSRLIRLDPGDDVCW